MHSAHPLCARDRAQLLPGGHASVERHRPLARESCLLLGPRLLSGAEEVEWPWLILVKEESGRRALANGMSPPEYVSEDESGWLA